LQGGPRKDSGFCNVVLGAAGRRGGVKSGEARRSFGRGRAGEVGMDSDRIRTDTNSDVTIYRILFRIRIRIRILSNTNTKRIFRIRIRIRILTQFIA
jgi:hypothetical protein